MKLTEGRGRERKGEREVRNYVRGLRSRELSKISTTVDFLALKVSSRLLVIEEESKENSESCSSRA